MREIHFYVIYAWTAWRFLGQWMNWCNTAMHIREKTLSSILSEKIHSRKRQNARSSRLYFWLFSLYSIVLLFLQILREYVESLNDKYRFWQNNIQFRMKLYSAFIQMSVSNMEMIIISKFLLYNRCLSHCWHIFSLVTSCYNVFLNVCIFLYVKFYYLIALVCIMLPYRSSCLI